MNSIDPLTPKLGDRIVDQYGCLEITSVDQPRGLCVVQRHAMGELKRNPFTMRFIEWKKRKEEVHERQN